MNDDELGSAEDEEDENVEDLNEAVLSVTQQTQDTVLYHILCISAM